LILRVKSVNFEIGSVPASTSLKLRRTSAGSKIDGLFNYIQQENKKGKKLFGGIVTNTNAFIVFTFFVIPACRESFFFRRIADKPQ